MKHLLLAAALLLSACKTVPTPPDVDPVRIPEVSSYHQKRAEQLPPLTDPSMGGVVKDSAEISQKYNELAYRYNSLLDVWVCVKDSINNEKLPETCLTK